MTEPGPAGRHLPHAASIDAYGNGGFRFADMSHRGSLILLPNGVWAWPVQRGSEINPASLQPLAAARDEVDVLIVGTGQTPWMPSEEFRWWLRDLQIGLEVMLTPAAVRTYNILQGEGRRAAAALIAVD